MSDSDDLMATIDPGLGATPLPRLTAIDVPGAITFERDYPGIAAQVQHVRADLVRLTRGCPAADALILLASELATNAILHSDSGQPDQTFAVRAKLYPGAYAWVEVIDRGGTWPHDEHDDERGRGLEIVAAVAGIDNWGIYGDAACRVAWFRLSWPTS